MDKLIQLSISEKDWKLIAQLAAEKHQSVNAYIRHMVEIRIQKHEARLNDPPQKRS
jgi:hypothetical protein